MHSFVINEKCTSREGTLMFSIILLTVKSSTIVYEFINTLLVNILQRIRIYATLFDGRYSRSVSEMKYCYISLKVLSQVQDSIEFISSNVTNDKC
jgi:hypothetical protein